MPPSVVFPWDGRDQEDQAETYYNQPLRAKNRRLEDENMRLKRLLRENGISWAAVTKAAPVSLAYSPLFCNPRHIRTRGSMAAAEEEAYKLPHLPAEVVLRILQYALTSDGPIVDPLSKLKSENVAPSEKNRGNGIAIAFLATCKAFQAEGNRLFWGQNTFVFTTPEAVRSMSELNPRLRRLITHVNFRIIARYYDDDKGYHKLAHEYHPTLRRDVALRVVPRTREVNLSRKGFRCYTWTQTIDFLDALRPPFDPSHIKATPRPRMFPNLETMRIDFVNFPEYFLPFSDTDLHEVASHDLGCTVNELIVTGLPCCEAGIKVGLDLSGMVRDEGLFLDGNPSFVQLKSGLKPLAGEKYQYCAKVVRSWRRLAMEGKGSPSRSNSGQPLSAALESLPPIAPQLHMCPPELAPAPREEGHPVSKWKKRPIMWRKVPINRGSDERRWVEFDRRCGLPVEDLLEMWGSDDEDDDGSFVCAKCGDVHGLDFSDWEE